METGKYVVDSSAFGKKCTKIPGSLTLPGIFSCTPGRSRTCDLQSRSLVKGTNVRYICLEIKCLQHDPFVLTGVPTILYRE